jgi:surface polysaccharide O-acyltransferase-like enzyme
MSILADEQIDLQMSLGFSGGAYGLYFIMGYLVKKGIFKKINSHLLFLISIITFIFTAIFQIWAYNCQYVYNVWYDFPFLFICSVAVFELGSRIKHVSCYSIIKIVASYSFAIYLIHSLVWSIILQKISSLALINPMKVLLLWISTFSISLLIAWIVNHIPKFGKYILYFK